MTKTVDVTNPGDVNPERNLCKMCISHVNMVLPSGIKDPGSYDNNS
jgi:hypothetical protein